MNPVDIKLSIIIPCYNCEKTLREAVESCYTQGFENESDFEIVMVDDGSTDGTRELLERIASAHGNIRTFFNEKNQGGGATRNTAVTQSLGEVIFGLDSDDILPPGTLLKMYNFLKEKSCDGVTIHRSIKFRGKDPKNVDHVHVSPFAGEKVPFESLLSKDIMFHPLYVTFMYTRVAFDKAGGYPTSHGYDTQGFGWRFLCAGLVAYTCPNAEYLHRIHFNESYFVREYNNGKINYNWRDILLENLFVFTEKARALICSFDCKDFTRNIMDELIQLDEVFIPDVESLIKIDNAGLRNQASTINPKICPNVSSEQIYIKRNSIHGYYLRIRRRLIGGQDTQKDTKNTNMKEFITNILKKIPLTDTAKKSIRRVFSPAWFYFLKKSTRPLSNCYGFERGTPVDRFYIENFLEQNRSDIKGECLELLSNDYTKKYGGEKVSRSDVLDIETTNKNATIIDDLRKLSKVADGQYDCVVLTQVLQFIDDVDAAISECHRVLKSGGVLLATLPSMSRTDRMSGIDGDYWRFTTASAKYLFDKKFSSEKVTIESKGNVRSGIYFYAGMSLEESSSDVLQQNDPQFPLIITVRAVK